MSKENLVIEKLISTVTKVTERPGMYAINRVEDIEYIFMENFFDIINSSDENILTNNIVSCKLFVNKWAEPGNNGN